MIKRVLRTARVEWRDQCGHVIPIGTRYAETVISPNDNDVGNTTWWRIRSCLDCVEMREDDRC